MVGSDGRVGRFVLEVGIVGEKRVMIVRRRKVFNVYTTEQLAFLGIDGASRIDRVGWIMGDGRGRRCGVATTVEFGDRFQHGDYFAQILTDDYRHSVGIESRANSLKRFID